jgi:hypothetical protein
MVSVPSLLETELTTPPAGVAQVPSPRQNVDDDAPVPLLRLATGRLLTPLRVVDPVHMPIWPLVGVATLETFPAPAGVAHVASPRQNVDAVAPVPLLR